MFNRLTTHVGTRALIEQRVYPLVRPQGQKRSCVVYQKVSGPRVVLAGSDSGLAHPRFRFRCIAPTYPEVKALAVQVTAAFSRYSGTLVGETVQGTFPESEIDVPPDLDDDEGMYAVLVDFTFWHAE